jgi:hypothetical protein
MMKYRLIRLRWASNDQMSFPLWSNHNKEMIFSKITFTK